MDIIDDYWSPFGECVQGNINGVELGASVSLSADGKLMLVSSFTDVILYQYERSKGWFAIKNFRTALVDNERGSYSSEISRNGLFIIVGSPNNPAQGFDTGAAQVFKFENGEWLQIGITLIGDKLGDLFGFSVHISNHAERIVIGAPGGGYARAFTLRNDMWIFTHDHNLGDHLPDSGFGYAVSLSGSGQKTVVGSPFYNDARGMVRAYDLDYHENTQQISGQFPQSQWGAEVVITEDATTIALAAPKLGYVKVYRFNQLLSMWEQVGFNIVLSGEGFGTSLAISSDGTTIAVGAPGNSFNGDNAGAGYVLEYDPLPVNGGWILDGQWKLKGDAFYGSHADDRCGESIAFSDNGKRVVISCPGANGGGYNRGELCVYMEPVTGDDDDFIQPSIEPTTTPTVYLSSSPSALLSSAPSAQPSASPTSSPTDSPSQGPTFHPTTSPTDGPTDGPTNSPTDGPTDGPTLKPTTSPTRDPTNGPTSSPTRSPVDSTLSPTDEPTSTPTSEPTDSPTKEFTAQPTKSPSHETPFPTETPSSRPSLSLSFAPSDEPLDAGGLDAEQEEDNTLLIFQIIIGLVGMILTFFGGICAGGCLGGGGVAFGLSDCCGYWLYDVWYYWGYYQQ